MELPALSELRELIVRIGAGCPVADPTEGIERLQVLEELKGAIAAAQARQTVAFETARRAEQEAAGVKARDIGKGIALEVALARRESPYRARLQLGWSRILVDELPHTLDALQTGVTSEWRAMLVARETGWLSRAHRAEVDLRLGPRLGKLGDRQVEDEARALATRLDPDGKAERHRHVATERTVTIRPAPDTMAYLTGFLPTTQAVAVYAALRAAADTTTAVGDDRGRGQIMADTLVERVTGQAHAPEVPLAVNLVMSDGTFLDAGADRNAAAVMDGCGPVPAHIARDLLARAASADEGAYGEPVEPIPMWIRRLYTRPDTGQLVTMESRSRFFTDAQRLFIRLRDQRCRTPYCGAPIRHADHVNAAVERGPTSLANAQGLCEACNYSKQASGFSSRVEPDGTIAVTTPSGHMYRSEPTSYRADLQRGDQGSPGGSTTEKAAAEEGALERPVPVNAAAAEAGDLSSGVQTRQRVAVGP